MCTCLHATGKNNVNGQHGYSGNDGKVGVRPVDPPAIDSGDTVIYDEPGRCGRETDSHCYHFRLVEHDDGHAILVRNGSGDVRVEVPRYCAGINAILASMGTMDSDGRYWTMQGLYWLHRMATNKARTAERQVWATAVTT